jgi:hypothetical protein
MRYPTRIERWRREQQLPTAVKCCPHKPGIDDQTHPFVTKIETSMSEKGHGWRGFQFRIDRIGDNKFSFPACVKPGVGAASSQVAPQLR